MVFFHRRSALSPAQTSTLFETEAVRKSTPHIRRLLLQSRYRLFKERFRTRPVSTCLSRIENTILNVIPGMRNSGLIGDYPRALTTMLLRKNARNDSYSTFPIMAVYKAKISSGEHATFPPAFQPYEQASFPEGPYFLSHAFTKSTMRIFWSRCGKIDDFALKRTYASSQRRKAKLLIYRLKRF